MSDAVLELACELIARPSITPQDQGCLDIIAARLRAIGFDIEPMPFSDVSNLWARRGHSSPLLCFAGHTDVVPTGPPEQWTCPPFDPRVLEGKLYGRGSADMKGALAAMVCACERFFAEHPEVTRSMAFLLTSDEEGPAVDGTRKVVDTLVARGVQIDYCLLGEPSSTASVGDALRIGRRGSLNGRLQIKGLQGHVAFPERHQPHPRCGAGHLRPGRCALDRPTGIPAHQFPVLQRPRRYRRQQRYPRHGGPGFQLSLFTQSSAATVAGALCPYPGYPRPGLPTQLELPGEPFYNAENPLLTAVQEGVRQVLGNPGRTSTGGALRRTLHSAHRGGRGRTWTVQRQYPQD